MEEHEYYIEVSVRDAREALAILNDKQRGSYTTDGSNYYIFETEEDAFNALYSFEEAGIEIEEKSRSLQESVVAEVIKSYNEKDTLYKQLHDKYAESIKGLKAGKIKKLTDLVSVQRWAMEDEHDTPGHDHKKMSATFKEERKLFKQWMAGDKEVQLSESVVTKSKSKGNIKLKTLLESTDTWKRLQKRN